MGRGEWRLEDSSTYYKHLWGMRRGGLGGGYIELADLTDTDFLTEWWVGGDKETVRSHTPTIF